MPMRHFMLTKLAISSLMYGYEKMSYNDTAFYAGRNFHQNRLDALQEPIVRINYGRNTPLIMANDTCSGGQHFRGRASVQ